MPTYDYRCNACGHTFDELQKFSDPVLTKCPACKKNKLERLFGGGGAIIFKGGGFYETDYRRAGEKPEGGEKSEAAEKGGGEAKETKSETPAADSTPKAETKTETKSEKKSSGGAKKKDK